MANIVFKSYNQDSGYLFPYYLEDLIPTNHPVRVVNKIVNKLDISAVEASYKGGGASCYNPRMMLKVIIYSYLNNVYSGRMMEKKLLEEVLATKPKKVRGVVEVPISPTKKDKQERLQRVAEALAQGKKQAEVAAELHVSEMTISRDVQELGLKGKR